jgi:hypothetical protein
MQQVRQMQSHAHELAAAQARVSRARALEDDYSQTTHLSQLTVRKAPRHATPRLNVVRKPPRHPPRTRAAIRPPRVRVGVGVGVLCGPLW